MPHSVSSEATSSPNDIVAHDELMADSPAPPVASQATDGDVAMAEIDAPVPATEDKRDVKLEDLFIDGDSDDEFPSSKPQDTPSSSSPGIATPLSPTWASRHQPSIGCMLTQGTETLRI